MTGDVPMQATDLQASSKVATLHLPLDWKLLLQLFSPQLQNIYIFNDFALTHPCLTHINKHKAIQSTAS
jgi:hypothetical protein